MVTRFKYDKYYSIRKLWAQNLLYAAIGSIVVEI